MIVINDLPRVFCFKLKGNEIKLPDPDINMTKEEVLNYYSIPYPVLTTAKVIGPKFDDDQLTFRFVSTIGTKG